MTNPANGPPYGAAPERTALAWQRSGLGVVVGCFLTVHSSVRLGVIPIAVGLIVGATGSYTWALLYFVGSAIIMGASVLTLNYNKRLPV